MRKTIEIRDDGPVAVTTNGATTITALLYANGLPETTPLPNGFNRELADWVVGIIEEREGHLWDQGVWRRSASEYELNPELDIPADAEHPCGTAMCFAGWTAELSGSDHVYDALVVKARARNEWTFDFATVGGEVREIDLSVLEHYNDDVVVPRDDPAMKDLISGSFVRNIGYDLDKSAADYLYARGFDAEKHAVVSLVDYAGHVLGINLYHRNADGTAAWHTTDPLELFEGDNTWSKVKGTIDAYTEMASLEQAHSLAADEFEDVDFVKASARQEILCRGVWRFMDSTDHLPESGFDARAIARELYAQGIGYDYHLLNAADWMVSSRDEKNNTRDMLEGVNA